MKNTPLSRLLLAPALAACGGPEVQFSDRQAIQPLPDRTPLSTVDRTTTSDHVRMYGTIDCADRGRWVLYAWRVRGTDVRGPDGIPTARPELAVTVDNPGAWSLPIPAGPRRLVVARNPQDGRLAWADPHGRAFPVSFDLEGIDLTCGDPITPAEDGTKVVSVGRPVLAPLPPEPSQGVALADTPLGRARPSRMHNAARRGENPGAHTEAAIRERYASSVDDESLRAMMPLLMQLSDDPEAADKLVAQTSKQLRGPAHATARSTSGPAPVGLIEIVPGTWENAARGTQ